MLVIDSSALIALYVGEPTAEWVLHQLDSADRLLMSTVNLTECLLVFRSRKPTELDRLTERLLSGGIDFIAPNQPQAVLAADARHRFPLNLGDCFAYALAKSMNLPLLTLDSDFRSTDVTVITP